jgi:AcrR family transcriptional regulator
MALLWQGVAPRTRGPKPAYSLANIADAAIALADAEGLAAVTMQRLAAQLGSSKMALYRYVPGRAELVAVMIERGLGNPPAENHEPWRARLQRWVLALFEQFCLHPWSIEATTGSRPIGPVEAQWIEAGLGILRTLGLEAAERLDILAVVTGHARALAQQTTRGVAAEDGLERQLGRIVLDASTTRAAAFPELRAAFAATQSLGHDEALMFGLNVIFDGLERLIEARNVCRDRASLARLD